MPEPTKKDIENAKQFKKHLDEAGKSFKNLTKYAKDFGKSSDKELKAAIKNIDDVNGELENMQKEAVGLSKDLAKISKKGVIKKDEAVALNNELKEIEKEILRIHKMKGKGGSILSGAALKSQESAVAKLQKRFTAAKGNIKDLAASSVDWDDKLSKVGPAFLRNWASGRKTAKAAGKEVAKMPGLFKAAGGAAKAMGGVLGGITKMLTGWPGLIFGAIKAAVDLTMAADQFVKDANKAFANLRGPDIMTGDVKKQFKEFNDMIYRAGENIRVGLDVTQIRELLLAVRMAGANITDLNKGLMTYRDAIYVASKASKILGLELPMVGDMMGKMIVDMRMDLDKMDEAFVQVAFDAKKSGLSTDRFWTTVQNASASLALYGVVVKTASKTVRAFTENMIGGADDAAAATDDMFEVFKTGGLKAQMALIQFAKQGGAEVPKIFEEMAAEAAGKVEAIEGEIKLIEAKGKKRTPEDVEQLKKLRSEMYSEQSKTNRFLKVAEGGTAAQASEIGALAKRAPEMVISAIKGEVGSLHKLQGHSLLTAIQAGKSINMSEKTIRMLVEISKVTEKRMTDLASKSGAFFNLSAKSDKETREGIAEAIHETATKTGEDQLDASDKLAALLHSSLGMDKAQAGTWTKMIRSDKKNAEEIEDALRTGDENMSAEIKRIISSERAIERMTAAHFKDQEKTESEMSEAAEDTFKGIVRQTLSYKEMLKIAKNEIQWRLSSLGVFQSLNTGVNNILKHLIGSDLSHSQKMAQGQIKATLATGNTLKELSHLARKGNLSQRDQVAITKKVQEKLAETKGDIKAKTVVGATLKGAGGRDPSAVIGGEVLKLREALKDPNIPVEQKRQNEIIIAEYQKTAKKLGKAQLVEDQLKTMTADLVKKDESAGKKLQEMVTLSKDDSTKPILEKILKMYNSKILTASTKEEKINEEIKKITSEELADIEKINNKALGVARAERDLLINTEKELIELNESNNTVATLARLQLRSSPEYMKKLKEEVKAQRIEGKSFEEISQGIGIPLEDIKKSYEGEEGKGAVPKKLIAAIRDQVPGSNIQGDFYDIVKGGFVNVKSGDILVDKSSLAKGIGGPPGAAVPAVKAAAGAGAAPGGGTTININVVATEKDLADKIANQIKKELYNRQISTSAYSLS